MEYGKNENEKKTSLYTIKVDVVNGAVDLIIETSEEADRLATIFHGYESVEASFFEDITDSVKLFAKSMAVNRRSSLM